MEIERPHPANASPYLILVSNSPRRAALLIEYGYRFRVLPPRYEEPSPPARSLSPAHWVQAMSYFKACGVLDFDEPGMIPSSSCEPRTSACAISPPCSTPPVAQRRGPTKMPDCATPLGHGAPQFAAASGLILAADTVACRDGRIFGKPRDREDARVILKSLCGTTHEVLTGVTLLHPSTGRRDIRLARTVIHMRAMTEADLAAYLDTGEWRGKAGAYGIQNHGDAFVESIEGSFTNVVGLPMEMLAEMIDADWDGNR